jgi:eukaryotic-like serine/threonine-protein kinase
MRLKNNYQLTIGQTSFKVSIEQDISKHVVKESNSSKSQMLSVVDDLHYEDKNDDYPSFSNYNTLKVLGEGSMGTVYLAENFKNHNKVAIKTMNAHSEVDSDSKKRFTREIDLIKKLNHKNIIQFKENGFHNDTFYLAIEYSEIGDLKSYLKRNKGKLHYKTALPLMLQILEGLAYAHKKCFVHRDLKPQNILLFDNVDKPIAKISDFGLAKSFDKAGFSGFTATGTTAGTPKYMPKEQLLDFKRSLPASDVFSIGATFYKVLTGYSPYNFKEDKDVLSTILDSDIIPIHKRIGSVPDKLMNIITKALSTKMEDRFQNATEMLTSLKSIIRKK